MDGWLVDGWPVAGGWWLVSPRDTIRTVDRVTWTVSHGSGVKYLTDQGGRALGLFPVLYMSQGAAAFKNRRAKSAVPIIVDTGGKIVL